jgi:hypothetical protein
MSTEPTAGSVPGATVSAEFRQILDTLPAFVWCAAPDGSIEFLNQRGLDYTGFTLNDITRWSWQETNILHPDDSDALAAAWRRIVASGREGDIQARMRRHDGDYRWFLFRVAPLYDAAGGLVAWWGVDVEIDERKRAEDVLRRSEAHLARAQRLSATGSFSYVAATAELTLSEETRRICGLDAAAGVTVAELRDRIHPDDLPLFHSLVHRTGREFRFDCRVLLPDGAVRYLQVAADAVRDDSGQPLEWVGAVRDVTDRKRSEDALNEVRSDLAHVARVATLGELTASIAHEINQPLGAIANNANATLRWLAAGEVDEARESVALVVADSYRASEIVARVRGMVRKSPPHKQWVDINDALREVLRLIASQAGKAAVWVESRLAGDLPRVWADRVQVQQVALNLMMNAIEAMADTPEALRRVVVSSAQVDDTTIQVAVRDHGPGVPPQQRARLFDPFSSTKPDGLGMGLAISRGIVQAHHGRLWASPNGDRGTTFRFTLPFAAPDGPGEQS